MKEYYQENEEYFDPNDILSQITIYVDRKSGNMSFACDWRDGDSGIIAIAETLFQLKYDELCDKILQELYKQCVNIGRPEDYMVIYNYIVTKKINSRSDNDPLVRPRDIK